VVIKKKKKCLLQKIISSLKNIISIAVGNDHCACLDNRGNVFTFRRNNYGQFCIGVDSDTLEYTNIPQIDDQNTPIICSSLSNEDVIDIKCGMFLTLVLTLNGDVLSCGSEERIGRKSEINFSSFEKIEELVEIIKIECGYTHSICIDSRGTLYVFGLQLYGQLGLGDISTRYKPIKHPLLSNIIDVSSGGDHTFVKTADYEIYAFGNNEFSQLGTKTENETQLTPIRVFEDNEDIWCSNYKSKAKSARK